MTSILLVGASGLLGSAFQSALGTQNLIVANRASLDVSRAADVIDYIRTSGASVVINCAADTDVDGSEDNAARAFAANAVLPDLLAQGCRSSGIRFVHFSSTGCYGARDHKPYDDFSELQPTTTHHRSKVAGEIAVRSAHSNSLILRLGWLYGGGVTTRRNFVRARIEESRGKAEMNADPNQLGNPTLVSDVVTQTLRLLEAGITGTFNCVASGTASRMDYVACILAAVGSKTRLVASRFDRRAPVSPNEAAINMRLAMIGLNIMPAWDEALTTYIRNTFTIELEGSS